MVKRWMVAGRLRMANHTKTGAGRIKMLRSGREHPLLNFIENLLLLLGLLAGPAGIALRLTTRPYRAMALSSAVAVTAVWGGLALSYAAPKLPPSFSILALVTTSYTVTVLCSLPFGRRQRPVLTGPTR